MNSDYPDYTPLPTGIIFDPKVGRPALKTYAILRSMAWANNFEHTPAMPKDQLLAIIGLEERQYYTHTQTLKKTGWLAIEHPRSHHIRFRFPLQKNAVLINKLPIFKESFKEKELIQLTKTAENCSQRLTSLGVHPGIAQRIIEQTSAQIIERYLKMYQWQIHYGHINEHSPGWLVKAILERYLDPPGFFEDVEFCEECGTPTHEYHKPECSQHDIRESFSHAAKSDWLRHKEARLRDIEKYGLES